ncbi:MAG: TRAP transporter large permease [Thermodesulfobacteriota bacterium]
MIDALINSDYFVMLMFAGVLFSLFIGIPVAFALMGMSLIFGYISFGDAIGPMLIRRVWDAVTNYILAAVPLFVFMGSVLEASGIAKKLFDAMIQLTAGLRGGLAVGTVLMCTIFAASTGIIGASEVVIGLLAIPVLLSRGYDRSLVCGTICAGGSLGTIIPPSVVIVVYGPAAGLSVGRLLAAAVFPGLMLAGIYVIYILIRCYLRPQDGPGLPKEERVATWGQRLKDVVVALLPPVLLIFAVTGTILLGWAAPTEAAALGAFGGVLLCAIYGRLNLRTLIDGCVTTVRITSMIMLVLTGGMMYTGVFLGMGGAEAAESLLKAANLGPYGTLFLFLGLIFLAGFILDWISVLLIFVPICVPIITKLGFNPIWFSVMFFIMIQTSYLTPPMAPAIFYLKGIVPPEISTNDMFRGVIPYIALQVIAMALIFSFPEIALWLPEYLMGGGFK